MGVKRYAVPIRGKLEAVQRVFGSIGVLMLEKYSKSREEKKSSIGNCELPVRVVNKWIKRKNSVKNSWDDFYWSCDH